MAKAWQPTHPRYIIPKIMWPTALTPTHHLYPTLSSSYLYLQLHTLPLNNILHLYSTGIVYHIPLSVVSPCVGDIQLIYLTVFGESPRHDKNNRTFTGQYEKNRSSSPFYCLEVPIYVPGQKWPVVSNTYQLCKIRACKKWQKPRFIFYHL